MIDPQVHKEIRTAIKDGDVEKVASLIGSDRDRLNMMTPFGTWLHVAASFGKLDIVRRLLELGADVNAYGGTLGGGPLNVAASEGHLDVVRYLLGQGAALDVSEPERNPLFSAIYGGHTDVARLLIEAGIDTGVRYTGESKKDMDALGFARERGRGDVAAMLASRSSGSA
jgi:ankyrin repeat protein